LGAYDNRGFSLAQITLHSIESHGHQAAFVGSTRSLACIEAVDTVTTGNKLS
jgi:hypothetical protein